MLPVATKEQVSNESNLFNEAWRILKKYYNISNSSPDEEWQELMQEASNLYKMPTGSSTDKLSKGITMAVLNHLEALAKERAC